MKKVIAVLIQKNSLSEGLQDNTTINFFSLEDEKVIEIESVKLENTSENHFSLLMALKNVTLVYANTFSINLRNVLSTVGIITKCKDEIIDDRFINQFIFN